MAKSLQNIFFSPYLEKVSFFHLLRILLSLYLFTVIIWKVARLRERSRVGFHLLTHSPKGLQQPEWGSVESRYWEPWPPTWMEGKDHHWLLPRECISWKAESIKGRYPVRGCPGLSFNHRATCSAQEVNCKAAHSGPAGAVSCVGTVCTFFCNLDTPFWHDLDFYFAHSEFLLVMLSSFHVALDHQNCQMRAMQIPLQGSWITLFSTILLFPRPRIARLYTRMMPNMHGKKCNSKKGIFCWKNVV